MTASRGALNQADAPIAVPVYRRGTRWAHRVAGFGVAVMGVGLAALVSGNARAAEAAFEPWGMAGFTAVGHALPAMLIFAGLIMVLGFSGKVYLFLPVAGLLAVAGAYPTTLAFGPFTYPMDADHSVPGAIAVVVSAAAALVTVWAVVPVDKAFRWSASIPQPAGQPGSVSWPLEPVRRPSSGYNVHAIMCLAFSVGLSIFGIAFGYVALRELRISGEQGRGLAIAGLVIGYSSLAAQVLLVVVLTMGYFIS